MRQLRINHTKSKRRQTMLYIALVLIVSTITIIAIILSMQRSKNEKNSVTPQSINTPKDNTPSPYSTDPESQLLYKKQYEHQHFSINTKNEFVFKTSETKNLLQVFENEFSKDYPNLNSYELKLTVNDDNEQIPEFNSDENKNEDVNLNLDKLKNIVKELELLSMGSKNEIETSIKLKDGKYTFKLNNKEISYFRTLHLLYKTSLWSLESYWEYIKNKLLLNRVFVFLCLFMEGLDSTLLDGEQEMNSLIKWFDDNKIKLRVFIINKRPKFVLGLYKLVVYLLITEKKTSELENNVNCENETINYSTKDIDLIIANIYQFLGILSDNENEDKHGVIFEKLQNLELLLEEFGEAVEFTNNANDDSVEDKENTE